MSVSCYFGLTESGKSYHVQNHVIPSWDKVIIFDRAHCFKGTITRTNPSNKEFLELFRKLRSLEKFSLVVRPSRNGNTEELFNKTVELSLAIGRTFGGRVDASKRIQMVTDEADFVCSPNYQSNQLKLLVNMGRHENVDSHFIARAPQRIHNDIRLNSTKVVTFRLQNSAEIPLFTDNFGRELAKKVRELPKYWRLEWSDNGETRIFDEKNSSKDLSLFGIQDSQNIRQKFVKSSSKVRKTKGKK